VRSLRKCEQAIEAAAKYAHEHPEERGTIVLDTASELWGWYGIWLESEGATRFTKSGEMLRVEWGKVNRPYTQQMYRLILSGWNVVVTAKARELYTRTGEPMGVYTMRAQKDSVVSGSPVFRYNWQTGGCELVAIDEVKAGDFVWTDVGWRRVKQAVRKPVRKHLVRVVTYDGIVDVTTDHSVFCDGRPTPTLEAYKVDWVPFPAGTGMVEIDEKLAWLLGFFVAEGSANWDGYKPYFQIHNQDKDLLEKCNSVIGELCARVFKPHWHEQARCFSLYIPTDLRQWFITCYSGRYKTVPPEVLNGSAEVRSAFLDGFYEGDVDTKHKSGVFVEWNTKAIHQKSSLIAVGVQYLLESLGYTTSVGLSDHVSHWLIYPGRRRTKRTLPKGTIREKFESPVRTNAVYDLAIDGVHRWAVGHSLVANTEHWLDIVLEARHVGPYREFRTVKNRLKDTVEVFKDPTWCDVWRSTVGSENEWCRR